AGRGGGGAATDSNRPWSGHVPNGTRWPAPALLSSGGVSHERGSAQEFLVAVRADTECTALKLSRPVSTAHLFPKWDIDRLLNPGVRSCYVAENRDEGFRTGRVRTCGHFPPSAISLWASGSAEWR